ncbi:MAG: hypothetical protein ACKVH6_18920, partial [Enterobacterales bacterium]
MNIISPIAALLLCALLSACSTTPRSDPNLCIEEAEMVDRNGAQTSSEVYNECISAQIKKDESPRVHRRPVCLSQATLP